MSDNKELDEIMKPLNIAPNEVAKQKAKLQFLQKAEESVQMKNKKLNTNSWFSRQSLLAFATGMAAMLILAAGITSAVNPLFLPGTISSKAKVTRYRIFPSGICAPKINSSDNYLGELSILPQAAEGLEIDKTFYPFKASKNISDDIHIMCEKCVGSTLNGVRCAACGGFISNDKLCVICGENRLNNK